MRNKEFRKNSRVHLLHISTYDLHKLLSKIGVLKNLSCHATVQEMLKFAEWYARRWNL